MRVVRRLAVLPLMAVLITLEEVSYRLYQLTAWIDPENPWLEDYE